MNTVIIYNPNSTGDGRANAERVAQQLRDEGVTVEVRKTTHAGHGEEIARELAESGEEVVLLSSSGDGGYHEIINGALSVPGSKLVVGVLPAGNANDHYSALGQDTVVQSIRDNTIQAIDAIKITATVDGKPWTRYAHSYAGIGVTVVAAHRLTVDRPNALTEKWIVAKALFSFKYTKLRQNGTTKRYSSIIFSNIDRMSKIITLSHDASVTDGKFEVSAIRFRSKLRLLAYLLTAATVGLKQSPATDRFVFETVRRTRIQMDGEVYAVDSASQVQVTAAAGSLRCVL